MTNEFARRLNGFLSMFRGEKTLVKCLIIPTLLKELYETGILEHNKQCK
jgi:hypothetical protein